MTDQMDSGQVPGDDYSPAESDQNSGAGDQLNSLDAKTVLNLLRDDPEFSEVVRRAVQGQKDRRFNNLERKQDAFEGKLARLTELMDGGLSQSDALFRLRVEEKLLAEDDQPARRQPGTANPRPAIDTDTLEILGLSANDPDVTRLLFEGKNTLEDFVGLARQKRERSQAPSRPATVTPTGGGQAPDTSEDALRADYNNRLSKIRRGDVAAVTALQIEFMKKGLSL